MLSTGGKENISCFEYCSVTKVKQKWTTPANLFAADAVVFDASTQQLFYDHYTVQPVLASTPISELEDSVAAKFYCSDAIADDY